MDCVPESNFAVVLLLILSTLLYALQIFYTDRIFPVQNDDSLHPGLGQM